jgi:hypothetical protein
MLAALARGMLSLGLLLALLLRCAIQLGVRGVSLPSELSRTAIPEGRKGDDSVNAASAALCEGKAAAEGASTRFRLAVDTVSVSLSVGSVARSWQRRGTHSVKRSINLFHSSALPVRCAILRKSCICFPTIKGGDSQEGMPHHT